MVIVKINLFAYKTLNLLPKVIYKPKIDLINIISKTKLQKSSNQHFTDMPEYIKHMILNTLQIFTYRPTTHIIDTTLIAYSTIYPFLVCV